MSELLTIKNLHKSYKKKKAVNGINFSIRKGEILCILGPNGAGKSTTINMLTGALRCDAGEISSSFTKGNIQSDLCRYKRHVGIVPQDLALYEDLTAEQNVLFFASLYGIKGEELTKSCKTALEFVHLLDKAKDKVNTFSGGMKRRLNIACAIAHKPSLLIMDEPAVGIDPQSRNHILESIKKLQDDGAGILYTTHYMEEVEQISTRIIIMDHGTIIAEGTKEELKEASGRENNLYIKTDNLDSLMPDDLYHIEGVKHVVRESDALKIITIPGIENIDRIASALIKNGHKIDNLSKETPSLETIFLNLTGRSLRD